MNWIIFGLISMLLFITLIEQRKTLDKSDWFRIVLLFLLCSLFINIFGLLIPLGCILGAIYAFRKRRNILIRPVIFGLVCLVITFYFPKISFNQIRELSNTNDYAKEFNQVKSVYKFSNNSEINSLLENSALEIKKKNPSTTITTDPQILFSIWVLSQSNTSIKDLDWLYYKAPQELHYYWQSYRPNETSMIEYIVFRNLGYMGVFKRNTTTSPYKLETIIEFDRFKSFNPMIP
jgi:hypothetical protein